MGSNLGREFSLLGFAHLVDDSMDHYFRYRERSGRQHSLEATLRRKPDCDFGIDFV